MSPYLVGGLLCRSGQDLFARCFSTCALLLYIISLPSGSIMLSRLSLVLASQLLTATTSQSLASFQIRLPFSPFFIQ